jgi:hypothetical protein
MTHLWFHVAWIKYSLTEQAAEFAARGRESFPKRCRPAVPIAAEYAEENRVDRLPVPVEIQLGEQAGGIEPQHAISHPQHRGWPLVG